MQLVTCTAFVLSDEHECCGAVTWAGAVWCAEPSLLLDDDTAQNFTLRGLSAGQQRRSGAPNPLCYWTMTLHTTSPSAVSAQGGEEGLVH